MSHDDMHEDEGGEKINRVTDESHCLDCQEPPYVRIQFSNSGGGTAVVMCQKHAQAWWDKWKHTATGQSAIFSNVANRTCSKG